MNKLAYVPLKIDWNYLEKDIWKNSIGEYDTLWSPGRYYLTELFILTYVLLLKLTY